MAPGYRSVVDAERSLSMPEGTDNHIGARVRIARNAAGLTQQELADFLDRTESWMANVEKGRMPLDRYSLITAIAERCDVDVVWLLGQPYSSAEHTSELQSLMRISYAVFCLKKKTHFIR